MKKFKIDIRFGTLSLVVLLATFSRVVPHPPNFAPIGAMALFGAAYYSKKYIAFLIPLIAVWFSDLFLNNVIYGRYFDGFVWFHQGFYWTYGAFLLIVLMGFALLKKVKVQNILFASLSASVLFFLASNFGVWASGTLYPKDVNGLMACYTAAIPFFMNTLLGELFYCAALFGAYEFVKSKIPALQSPEKIKNSLTIQ